MYIEKIIKKQKMPKTNSNNKSHLSYFLISFFLLFLINLSSQNYLQIPFHTKYIEKHANSIFEFNYQNYLYFSIHVGSNKQLVDMKLQLNDYPTYILKQKQNLGNNYEYNFYPKTSDSYYFYKSFKFYAEEYESGIVSFDDFRINQNLLILKYKFIFVNETTISSDLSLGSIGLGVECPPTFPVQDINFIDQLKNDNIISGKKLFFKFNDVNDGDGSIFIGENFEKVILPLYQNYKEIKIPIFNNHWSIKFEKVELNDENIINEDKMKLDLYNEYIISTTNYKNKIIEIFFDELINEKICSMHNIGGLRINRIKCKMTVLQKIKNFPKLKFTMKNIYSQDFIIELTHEELFEIEGNVVNFKILFPQFFENEYYIQKQWIFGKMFLRNNLLILDKENKTINFYVNKVNNIEKNINEMNIMLWIYPIVICGIIIIFGIFLNKYFKLVKKINKRKNNLMNEMKEYASSEDEEKI